MSSQYPRLSPGNHASPYMVSVCENNYLGFTTWEMIAQRELFSQRKSFSVKAFQFDGRADNRTQAASIPKSPS